MDEVEITDKEYIVKIAEMHDSVEAYICPKCNNRIVLFEYIGDTLGEDQ